MKKYDIIIIEFLKVEVKNERNQIFIKSNF